MKMYIITYDPKELEGVPQTYALVESIKRVSGYWAHPHRGCWLVKTNKTSEEIFNTIIIPDNFHIMIARITDDYYGYGSKDIWDWMKE